MHTLIIGLDAFDPVVFEKLSERGQLPNLSKYVQTGGYSRFAVANPAQSEVSWTSIATGLSPGSHGMFDFVHRSPENYALSASLLPTKSGLSGMQFVPPHTARTLFEQATREGYPATSLWWPATFPARPELPVQTIPGLGTPDIQGRLGIGTVYTLDEQLQREGLKTPVEVMQRQGKGRFSGLLYGPKKNNNQVVPCAFELEIDEHQALLRIGKQSIPLIEGQWSPIIEVPFKVGPLITVQAITRAILTQSGSELRLYFLPVQIHPLNSPWRYATGFVKKTWNSAGPFLTLGWPQDTTALEEGWIEDRQFLDLCESIEQTREKVLSYHLSQFHEGILACVFDTLDRVQHMFWKDRPDLIEAWYTRLDAMIGRIEGLARSTANRDPRILIVSDHGFANFDYKVHLNRWLEQQNYLVQKPGSQENSLRQVDWSKSICYGIGLNSLYLNLQGREGLGCVSPGEKEALLDRLADDLLTWKGPDGRSPVQEVYPQTDSTEPLAKYGPDLIIGYTPGYRASAETGLGQWKEAVFEVNRDHWGADHCYDPVSVPGVLFCSHGLQDQKSYSFRDFPELALGGKIEKNVVKPQQSNQEEAQDLVEERLKSLGYL